MVLISCIYGFTYSICLKWKNSAKNKRSLSGFITISSKRPKSTFYRLTNFKQHVLSSKFMFYVVIWPTVVCLSDFFEGPSLTISALLLHFLLSFSLWPRYLEKREREAAQNNISWGLRFMTGYETTYYTEMKLG